MTSNLQHQIQNAAANSLSAAELAQKELLQLIEESSSHSIPKETEADMEDSDSSTESRLALLEKIAANQAVVNQTILTKLDGIEKTVGTLVEDVKRIKLDLAWIKIIGGAVSGMIGALIVGGCVALIASLLSMLFKGS